MGRFGTDATAWAAILGGAAVSGVASLGLLFGDQHEGPATAVEVECSVASTALSTASIVVTRGGDENVVVVAPTVRVHRPRCADADALVWTAADEFDAQLAEVRVTSMEQARERMERVREEMERTRERMESRALDLEGLDAKLEGLDLDLDLEGLGEEISMDVQRDLRQEMQRLEKEMKRLERGGGL